MYSKKQLDKFKDVIIENLSKGRSLKNTLEEVKETPSRQIVYNWLNEKHTDYDSTFLDNYIRAREESADLDAENIANIAEKTLTGEYDPNSARVAIDAFKWIAGKKRPKKYGDKLDLKVDVREVKPIITKRRD